MVLLLKNDHINAVPVLCHMWINSVFVWFSLPMVHAPVESYFSMLCEIKYFKVLRFASRFCCPVSVNMHVFEVETAKTKGNHQIKSWQLVSETKVLSSVKFNFLLVTEEDKKVYMMSSCSHRGGNNWAKAKVGAAGGRRSPRLFHEDFTHSVLSLNAIDL